MAELEKCSLEGNSFWKKFQGIRNKEEEVNLSKLLVIQDFFSNLYNDKSEENSNLEEINEDNTKGIDLVISVEDIRAH